ncbi:MAG TPA: hypothetical protein VEY12_13165 [Thermoplasmata archaeon]|nr:hypothetical protein [Thermoplasmata archaeon]
MSEDKEHTLGFPGESPPWRARVHAQRLPTPQACGCGLPVSFDLGRQEFFCIGCGSSTQCTCRGFRLGPLGHPVNVL